MEYFPTLFLKCSNDPCLEKRTEAVEDTEEDIVETDDDMIDS